MPSSSHPPAARRLAADSGSGTPGHAAAALPSWPQAWQFFSPGSDVRTLRNELIQSSGVAWQQQIALNAGYLTLGAVRAGCPAPG